MTGNAHPGTPILGSLRSADGDGVVRVEGRFGTGIDDVWSALTDRDRLARWYGQVEGDLRVGGEFRARLEGWEGTGRVEACEPPQRLRITTNAGEPYDLAAEAELTADGDETIVVIEARGMPLEMVAAYGVGWQIHAENLAAYLAGSERVDTEKRWAELSPAYEAMAAGVGDGAGEPGS